MSAAPLRLSGMLRAGVLAVRRYTGTLLVLYAAQALVMLVMLAGVAVVLAGAFADRPLFDSAVDGDLVALVQCVRAAPHVVTASAGVVTALLLLWGVASWLLTGGLLAVLVTQPEGRAATARTFGAGAADTFLPFARLGLLSLALHLALLVPVMGMAGLAMLSRLTVALSDADLARALLLGLVPPLLVRLVLRTFAELARADLVARQGHGGRSAARAYGRAIRLVVRRPIVLLHAALLELSGLAILLLLAWAVTGHALLGTGGALTLFVLRQGVALLRLALTVASHAGQVEAARTLPVLG